VRGSARAERSRTFLSLFKNPSFFFFLKICKAPPTCQVELFLYLLSDLICFFYWLQYQKSQNDHKPIFFLGISAWYIYFIHVLSTWHFCTVYFSCVSSVYIYLVYTCFVYLHGLSTYIFFGLYLLGIVYTEEQRRR